MRWIIELIFRYKNISSLLLTAILSLAMLSANTLQQQKIARGLTLTLFFPFQFAISQIQQAKYFFSENKKLKEEITALNLKCNTLEQAEEENKRLRKLIGFREQFNYSLIPARAIAREPSHLYRSIIINSGQKQGVELYMPVINKSGIIGKVIQVMPNISMVELLTDPSGRVSVMTKKNNEVGIVETVDGRKLFIKYKKHAEIHIYDTLVTSGLGGIYPRGLSVGIVTTIEEKNDPLFKYVIIDPTVDFEHIEELFVIKSSPQWSLLCSELDSIGKKQ